jgi:hypothetical protein
MVNHRFGKLTGNDFGPILWIGAFWDLIKFNVSARELILSENYQRCCIHQSPHVV